MHLANETPLRMSLIRELYAAYGLASYRTVVSDLNLYVVGTIDDLHGAASLDHTVRGGAEACVVLRCVAFCAAVCAAQDRHAVWRCIGNGCECWRGGVWGRTRGCVRGLVAAGLDCLVGAEYI